ncbi:carbon storage regulator CsrA [Alkalihalobacillus sp. LMS39]|uniref:carbon storage regulator CsrA n=1 Tax=Alkalihalobacillus sp. LMS39 TaxID=2924032 RepID=UPI001FB32F33|nr:carbon storage regulator CsrA [Alkalihalobacillus sp. LMS39]UOE96558.1 carbon storage regulator CsrA [Alkalihalobacillus sp. LMS39]
MLVLSRKKNQSIKIADDIEITILAVDGEQVKLGISAPKHVEIHRKEVYLAIQQENSQAGSVTLDIINKMLKRK